MTGTFDGNGHAISNVSNTFINNSPTGTVKNLVLINVSTDEPFTNVGNFENNYFYTTADDISIDDEVATRIYKLTLPEGVTASGEIVTTANGNTYAVGNVNFRGAKDGYVINSANITGNTTIKTTLNPDTSKHYVFSSGNGTYTLAKADNIGDYPDLIQVYEVTLPDGVEVTSGVFATADGKTYATGSITFSSETDIKGLERGDGGNYTVNIDSDVAFELVIITALTFDRQRRKRDDIGGRCRNG